MGRGNYFCQKINLVQSTETRQKGVVSPAKPITLPLCSSKRCTQKELDNIEIDIVFEKYYLIFQCLQPNLCT